MIFRARSRRMSHQSQRLLNLGVHGGIRRKLLCLALVFALLSAPGFDVALQQAPVLASSAVTSATSSIRNLTTFFEWLLRTKTKSVPRATKRQETTETRSSGVRSIR